MEKGGEVKESQGSQSSRVETKIREGKADPLWDPITPRCGTFRLKALWMLGSVVPCLP